MLSGTKQKERLHRDLACALCRCSLRKKPTFGDATTGFPAKWRLRNEGRNSLLMTRHYPDLGSASDWLNQIFHAARPIRSTTQIWVVTQHQYGISALVSQTPFGGKTSGSVDKCRLFSQAWEILACRIRNPGLWNLEYILRNLEPLYRLESGVQVPVAKNKESSTWNP